MGMIRKTLSVTSAFVVPVGPAVIRPESKKQRRNAAQVREQRIANALTAAVLAGEPITLAQATELVDGNPGWVPTWSTKTKRNRKV